MARPSRRVGKPRRTRLRDLGEGKSGVGRKSTLHFALDFCSELGPMGLANSDRLAPPLMYAFRAAHSERDAKVQVDLRDRGERVIASRRVTTRAPISERELRKLVNSDLVALLNTTNLDSAEDLSTAPEVRKSVLNFGFPDLSWRTIDENGLHEIAREIEIALSTFEPRLAKDTIQARRDMTTQKEELKLRFLVKADLVAQPVDVPVEFIAEVEFDSGKIKIDRL